MLRRPRREAVRPHPLFDADLIIADKKHKDDIVFRVYVGDKLKDIKLKMEDKILKLIDKSNIEDMMTPIGNRDDAAFIKYIMAKDQAAV